jgi:N4-gp56 family major capsid protein
MANTNFGLLTSEQKTAWSLDFWKQARNLSFINKFLGKDSNSMIQHITELKKSEKGARAVITLVADLEGDGVVGDRTLKGNEEIMKSYDQVIRIDQIRNANKNEGRIADQKSIVNFRENSRDKLAYWLSDRMDQMALQGLAGVSYANKPNGAPRVGSELQYLEFAQDIKPPTNRRFGRWNFTTKSIEWGTGTSGITSTDVPAWELLVAAKAYAKDNYIRGIRDGGGEETFHVFLTPQGMARLKNDPTYMANLRYAQTRDDKNPLFTGSTVKVDGLYLHEFRHVPNTSGASGSALINGGGALHSKWGSGGDTEGFQMLFCGAQAMGMADLGNPEWVEEDDDYKNTLGISVAKTLGFLKPQFYTQYSGGTVQDHGVFSVYAAQ